MALIVEDGSGKPDAESYVAVSDFQSHCDKVGYDLGSKADAELEQALRRGTRGIDGLYGPRFIGVPVTVSQALEWPRIGAVWRGVELPDDQVPQKVKDAACEAAWRELTAPGSLAPDISANGVVARRKVGDVETEFSGPVDSSRPIPTFASIDGLLSGLLKSGSSSFGWVFRA